MRCGMTLAHTMFSLRAEEPHGVEGQCERGSPGSSPLICQESSGANYCRQRRLLRACVSKTAASQSHSTTLLANGRSVNEGCGSITSL